VKQIEKNKNKKGTNMTGVYNNGAVQIGINAMQRAKAKTERGIFTKGDTVDVSGVAAEC